VATIVFERALTLDEFHRLPEANPPLEMGDDGAISQKVSPGSEHAAIQAGLVARLNRHGMRRRLGRAFTEQTIELAGKDKVPDLSFYRADRLPVDPDGRLTFHPMTPPDLVVEIVSPSQGGSNRGELEAKCHAWWAAHGVALALLIDAGAREILAYWSGASQPARYAGAAVLPLKELLPDLAITAEQVFAYLEPMPDVEDAD